MNKAHTALTVVHGGALVDLLNPRPDAIDFGVVAEHLAKIARFNGATSAPYSVAQHSVVVADALPPEIRIYGLLHDAHEAYTGDLPTPTQAALRALGMGDQLALLQSNIDAAIWRAALVPPPSRHILDQVAKADAIACKTEARDLIPGANPADFGDVPALRRRIKPLPWHQAHAEFVTALELSGLNPRRLAA